MCHKTDTCNCAFGVKDCETLEPEMRLCTLVSANVFNTMLS